MIFLDSSFLISLIIDKETRHIKSVELLDSLTDYKVINNIVLSETLNGIHRCDKRKSLEEIYNILIDTAEVVYITSKDYSEAININKYYNNAINYSDCLILKTMQDKKITKIVSYDKGFDKIKGINRIYLE